MVKSTWGFFNEMDSIHLNNLSQQYEGLASLHVFMKYGRKFRVFEGKK